MPLHAAAVVVMAARVHRMRAVVVGHAHTAHRLAHRVHARLARKQAAHLRDRAALQRCVLHHHTAARDAHHLSHRQHRSRIVQVRRRVHHGDPRHFQCRHRGTVRLAGGDRRRGLPEALQVDARQRRLGERIEQHPTRPARTAGNLHHDALRPARHTVGATGAHSEPVPLGVLAQPTHPRSRPLEPRRDAGSRHIAHQQHPAAAVGHQHLVTGHTSYVVPVQTHHTRRQPHPREHKADTQRRRSQFSRVVALNAVGLFSAVALACIVLEP